MLYRLSVDELCKDVLTCPSVWWDDERPDELVVVGRRAAPAGVPIGPDEVAYASLDRW